MGTLWSSGAAIPYNVPEGLVIGENLYTINFTDEYENTISHTVKMTVREAVTSEIDFPIEFIIMISVISGDVVIVIIKRRIRKNI